MLSLLLLIILNAKMSNSLYIDPSRYRIRIYAPPSDPSKHSFYVGHMIGGITERVTSFEIDKTTTFSDLRQMICWREQNGFFRRTILYLELLEAMKRSENKYAYSKADERDFRFGIKISEEKGHDGSDELKKDTLPRIIQKDIEDEPIDQIISIGLDLILVPLVLIPK